MGGLFGVVSKEDCVQDLFFGVDYHSHLGTAKAGMSTLGTQGFNRAIHNIENSPFRTKFEHDLKNLTGISGIGCISDGDSQPLVVRSHLGEYAIACVGKINNMEEILSSYFDGTGVHLLEGSRGRINETEFVSMIIDQSTSFTEGIQQVHQLIDGSMTILLLTQDGLIAARDKLGRTPLVIGAREGAYCAASESFSFLKLDYHTVKELGPAEIVQVTPEGMQQLAAPGQEMKICSFLWTYYGYPSSVYEGVNVENMRYRCGQSLARQDAGTIKLDSVAGVPDTGLASAIGYANESDVPFSRPLVKYTPTWPRSFTPQDQSQRSLIAKMKIVPIHDLIENKDLLFIDDSIVRGTQLRDTVGFLFENGAKSVHIRPASPPYLFSCKYLSFSRSNSQMELFTRRTIQEIEGRCDNQTAIPYADATTDQYAAMVERMRAQQGFSSLKFITIEDIVAATTLPACKLCTYCWNGKG
ncbi:amidophosphoribosyltransferase [Ruminococcaceae bacterium OttesenSCG-928-N02]|nr:amidophosphoribosyltransferase [Ruminococcaceae bacterium OttesenSCG-928-N02]